MLLRLEPQCGSEAYPPNPIAAAGAKNAGIVIALDRQEVGYDSTSAVQELEQKLNFPVISIVKLQELIEMLEHDPEYREFLDPVLSYRRRYGS